MKHEDMIKDLETLRWYFKEQRGAYPVCLERAAEMLSKYRWIPVSDGLPENGNEVLIFTADGEYMIGYIRDDEDGEWSWLGVLAWMPLPEPYEGEAE